MNRVTNQITSRREKITAILSDGAEQSVAEVAQAAGIREEAARYVLEELLDTGAVRKRRCEARGCVVFQIVGSSAIDRARHARWVCTPTITD